MLYFCTSIICDMDINTILTNMHFDKLSEMQRNAIAIIRNNINAMILAPTGSGKTLAFLIPLLETIDFGSDTLQAVVLSPTRELAQQTLNVLKQMDAPCRAMCCYGGRPAMTEHKQLDALKPHIIIATPGRFIDHADKGNIKCNKVKTLVIDEFDKMLELNFQDEVETVLQKLTGRERCVLVSATDMKEIPSFVAFKHHQPAILNCLGNKSLADAPQIEQFVVHSPEKDKLQTLDQLLRKLGDQQTIVFVNYREAVERTAAYLNQEGHSVAMFHGGMEQSDRETALSLFRSHSVNTLVSTDLAARGIDIASLQNIIQYHLPNNAETYLHRCGRTGRWEAQGASYTIVGPEEKLPDYLTDAQDLQLTPPFPSPAKPQWVTLYIGRGKKDKLGKGDVVGFLCKTGKLNATEIGTIDIRERYAYVAIRQACANVVLRNIAGEKIKKMSTRIELIKTSRLVPKIKAKKK